MPIRLVIADDHPVVLDGLAQVFALEPDCKVVARATDGDEAIAAVREHWPDILADLRMPRRTSRGAARAAA
jgi:DNA-binding NarL/FixJ family response regulator